MTTKRISCHIIFNTTCSIEIDSFGEATGRRVVKYIAYNIIVFTDSFAFNAIFSCPTSNLRVTSSRLL